MSGFLLLLATDWIMCETTKQANTGIRCRFMVQLEDLDFTDIDLHHTISDAKESRQAHRNCPERRFEHQ